MSGALAGIRVLDMSRVLAGPWVGQLLADLGAEVIKVERPGVGDDTRGWGPPFLKDRDGKETRESAYFLSANRGKKSITLDISKPQGQAIARELAEEIGATPTRIRFLGLLEDIFDWAGQKRHELYLVYDVDLADRAVYDAEEVEVLEPDGTAYPARWRSLADFRSGARLVPDGLLDLIPEATRPRPND